MAIKSRHLDDKHVIPRVVRAIDQARAMGKEPCFTFERISSHLQEDGYSLELQASSAVEYARRSDLYVAYQFDVTESARTHAKRKVFNQMLNLALQFEVKHLVFRSVDRMTRNLDSLQFLRNLVQEHDVNLHFYAESRVFDRKAHHNDIFVLSILSAVAEQMTNKLSDDIRSANRKKAEAGIAPFTHAPYGYIYDTKAKRFRRDPVTERATEMIFAEFDLNQQSIAAIVDKLKTEGVPAPGGGKEWQRSTVHYILTNPFYAGLFWFGQDKKLMQGIHASYCSVEAFEARKVDLGDRFAGRRKRTFEYPLAGLLKCQCGRMMTGAQFGIKKKGKLTEPRNGYIHKCPLKPNRRTGEPGGQVTLWEKHILEQIDEALEDVRFDEEYQSFIEDLLADHLESKRKSEAAERGALSREIEKQQRRRETILEHLAEGLIDDKVGLNAKLNEINKEIRRLSELRNTMASGPQELLPTVKDTLNGLRNFLNVYASCGPHGKGSILRQFTNQIVLLPGGPQIEWKEPFSFLMGTEREHVGADTGSARSGEADPPFFKDCFDPLIPKLGLAPIQETEKMKQLEGMILNFRLWLRQT